MRAATAASAEPRVPRAGGAAPLLSPVKRRAGLTASRGWAFWGARSRVSAGLRRSKDGEGSVLEKLCSETLLAFGR